MKKFTQEQIVGLKEFRTDTEKYIKAVNKGAQFLIVRRSKPVFRLEPIEEVWETIGNFKTKTGKGVKAEKLIAALKA